MCWKAIRDFFTDKLLPRVGWAAHSESARSPPGDQYLGWLVIHRTSETYHRAFPEWPVRVGRAIRAALPGAEVRHDVFNEAADEPVVLAPTESSGAEIERVRSLAAEAYRTVAHEAVGIRPSGPVPSAVPTPGAAGGVPNAARAD